MNEVHLWVPDIDVSNGGIQAFSYFLSRALREVQPDLEVQLLAKHGRSNKRDTFNRGSGRICSAFRTMRFGSELLWTGFRHPPIAVISSHIHFLPAAFVLKRLRGVRYVGVAHGIEAWSRPQPALRAAVRAADLILSVSRFTQGRIASEYGIPAERLRVLPNTFDQTRFHPGPRPAQLLDRYRLPADAKIIFSFGRLAKAECYKGFDRIIAALPKIQRAVPEVRYLIGGSGDDRPRLVALAEAAGVADRVIFTGFLPTGEVAAHYNLCDVFAMPSTGEGFGIVFLEALACGKPVLAGNRDGSTDPLMDGRMGALVDPLDPEQIAGTLTQILLRNYPHPMMWQPNELRRQVIDEFGFTKFATTLQSHLHGMLPAAPFFGC